MLVETLKDYARYNLWANKRLSKIILENDKIFWNEKNQSSFGSIGETIIHILWAEKLWLHRIEKTSSERFIKPDCNSGPESISKFFIEVSTNFLSLVSSFNEELLSEFIHYHTITQGKVSSFRYDMILHCINHSTFHRGQIITMLREYGIKEFVSLDYINFKKLSDENIR